MQTYIISYDMAKGGDYDALYEVIQSYEAWAHITDSTWAVVTEDNAKKVRDHLSEYLPDGSRLFVVRSGDEAAWQYVNSSSNEWLDISTHDKFSQNARYSHFQYSIIF